MKWNLLLSGLLLQSSACLACAKDRTEIHNDQAVSAFESGLKEAISNADPKAVKLVAELFGPIIDVGNAKDRFYRANAVRLYVEASQPTELYLLVAHAIKALSSPSCDLDAQALVLIVIYGEKEKAEKVFAGLFPSLNKSAQLAVLNWLASARGVSYSAFPFTRPNQTVVDAYFEDTNLGQPDKKEGNGDKVKKQ